MDANEITGSLTELLLTGATPGWVAGPDIDISEPDLNRLELFLFSRKVKILEEIGDKAYMVISSLPAYRHNKAIFSLHDDKLRTLILNPPLKVRSYGNIFCGRPYPTINGLRADNSTPYKTEKPATPYNYIEVFTSGYIEFGKLMHRERDSELIFAAVADAAYIVNFIRFIEKAYGSQPASIPIAVNFAIYNARGMWLAVGKSSEDDKLVKWPGQHLELGKYFIKSIRKEGRQLPRKICDHLWQAFHRERADVFDAAGSFRL